MASHRLLYLLILIPFGTSAQSWKTNFDQAVEAYEERQFERALSEGEKAYLLTTDSHNKAYILPLLTAICLQTQQIEKGLKWVGEEIEFFQQIQGNSKSYADALNKQVIFLELNNDPKTALQKIGILLPIAEKAYGLCCIEYYQVLLRQGNLLISQGDFKLASTALNTCVTYFRNQPEASDDFYMALLLSAEVDYKVNEFVSAEKKFKEYIEISDKKTLTNTPDYHQAKTLLSKIHVATSKNGSGNILSDKDVSVDQKEEYYLKVALHHQLKPDSALKYFKICERIVNDSSIENNTAFSLFINYATVLINQHNLIEADNKLMNARQLASKLYPDKNRIEYGYLYKTEADLSLARGNVLKAEEKYWQAVDAIKLLPAEARTKIVKSIVHKLEHANVAQVALRIIEPFATNQEDVQTLTDREYIEISKLYCNLLPYSKNASAIDYLKRQTQLTKSSEVKCNLQITLAIHVQRSGDSEQAYFLLSEILKNQLPTTKVYADATYQLARVQQQQGHYREAEQNYSLAIKSYQASSAWHNELMQAHNSLATFYITLGNYNAAEQLYSYLLTVADRNSGFYSTLIQNLAAIYEQTLRYKDAQKLWEETLQRDRENLGALHPNYAITLQNLAVLYQKTGDLAKAKNLFIQALEIDKNSAGDQSLSYASKLENLGTVYQELDDFDKARSLYEAALKIRLNKVGKEHPDYIFNEYGLAVLYQQQKDYVHAYPLFKEVITFYLKQIKELFPALSDTEKTAFYNKITEVINAYQDFAIEYGQTQKEILGDLYNFRLATKALLLNASSKIRHRILRSGNAVILSKYIEWQHTKEELTKLCVLNIEEKARQQDNIKLLEVKANELEKYLSTQSELFATLHDKKNIAWQDIKAALKPGEAAIEMIRLRMNQKNDSVIYAALILRQEMAVPSMVLLSNGRQMENREFINYKNCTKFLIENNFSYSIFWQPIAAALKDVNTVFFSSDGVYNKINLLTLFDPGTKKYVIEQFNINLVSNTKEILNQPTTQQAIPEATLLGFPDFSSSTANHTMHVAGGQLRAFSLKEIQSGIPELPGTKEELNKINELLTRHQWKTKMYLRDQATEENIKAQNSPALLHIATHGFFIESTTTNTPPVYAYDILKTDNPLLHSGLLLAGAEKYFQLSSQASVINGEDGILTALEAMNLNLDNTELVVLSACETGSGETRNGEGVFGLQRSFLVSGARSIMMSLWQVNDIATQELMIEFYRQWLETRDKADALRKAQLILKEKYTNPFYWGAFVMIGK